MMTLFWGLKSAILYVLYVSVKIGQFILTALHSILLNLWYLAEKLFLFLSISYEDFIVFSHDFYQRINYLVGLLIYLVEYGLLTIYALLDRVFNIQRLFLLLIKTLYNGIEYGLLGTFEKVKNIFIILKQILILFGDGVWFVIIYLPKSVASLGPLCWNYFTTVAIKTNNLLKSIIKNALGSAFEFYNFITDVPWEAFIGLMIAICFLLIFLQFYNTLVGYARSKLSLIVNAFKERYNSVKMQLYLIYLRARRTDSLKASFKLSQTKPTTSYNSTDWNDSRLCVICQDRDKCIVVLPCKHLCICDVCIDRQIMFNKSCPICRERIRRTMKIYV